MDEQNIEENSPLCEVMYHLRLCYAQAHYLVCVADLV